METGEKREGLREGRLYGVKESDRAGVLDFGVRGEGRRTWCGDEGWLGGVRKGMPASWGTGVVLCAPRRNAIDESMGSQPMSSCTGGGEGWNGWSCIGLRERSVGREANVS
jgi:hypothetical protein